MGIIESRHLRASELRYMNDSTELVYALNLLDTAITARSRSGSSAAEFLSSFSQWLHSQINQGPMLFSASFRANGNLLSQWRGYSNHGKGVSLGFNHEAIQSLAVGQDFYLGQCLYDSKKQHDLAYEIVDCLISMYQEDDDGSAIFVYNKTGETIVSLDADEYGNGEVGAFNRKGKGRVYRSR